MWQALRAFVALLLDDVCHALASASVPPAKKRKQNES